MFDFLDDLVDSIGDVASSTGDAIASGVGSVGDLISSGVDSVDDWWDSLDLGIDLSGLPEFTDLNSLDPNSLSYATESEPLDYSFLNTSINSAPELVESPDTMYDLIQGLDTNPVATEASLKELLQNPYADISPSDYSLSSPTVLDKLISRGNNFTLEGASDTPQWFDEGQSLPQDWINSYDNGTGYTFGGRSTVTDPKAYAKEKNWFQKLIEPTTDANGASGKSTLASLLTNAKTAASIYGALSGKGSNSPKYSQLKSMVNPIGTKTMNWNTSKIKRAQGGSIPGALSQASRCGALRSPTGGQEDDIPILASGGEYVFDADSVSALGDGNSEAGAKKLDQMRVNIRKHKRSAPSHKIPPKAKKPEAYLGRSK